MDAQTILIGVVHIMAIAAVLIVFQYILWKLIMRQVRGRGFTLTMYLLLILGAAIILIPVEAVLYVSFILFKNFVLAEQALPYEATSPDSHLIAAAAIAVVWGIGAIWQWVVAKDTFTRQRHNTRAGELIPVHLQEIFREECRNMGISDITTIQYNRYVNSPQTVYWKKKNIVMVPSVDASEYDFRVVLRHELYHVKHRDYRWRYFMTFLTICTWFNPASLCFLHELDFWMDVCRDAEVVNSGITDANEYYHCVSRYNQSYKMYSSQKPQKMKKKRKWIFRSKKKTDEMMERRSLLRKMMNLEQKKTGKFEVAVVLISFVIGAIIAAGLGFQIVQRGVVRLWDIGVEQVEEADGLTLEVGEVEYEKSVAGMIFKEEATVQTNGEVIIWNLSKGISCCSEEFWLLEGQILRVQGFISPTGAEIGFGYADNDVYTYCIAEQGFGYGFNIQKDGNYRVFFENLSEIEEVEIIFFVTIE